MITALVTAQRTEQLQEQLPTRRMQLIKMKCSELLLKGTRILKEKGIESSRLEAEVLLAFAWGWERTHLLIFSDEPVPEDVEKRFYYLICRRSRGVPVRLPYR